MIQLLIACTPDEAPADLMTRAYTVSEKSNELFVFDYASLEEVGSVDTSVAAGRVNGNHMAMVTPDGAKVYVTASEENTLVVVDAETLTVTTKLAVGNHATHVAMRAGTNELWVMAEDDDAVVVVDTETDEITRTITGESLNIPHFARFSGDFAYVPSIGGNAVSVVDLATYAIVDTIVPEGLQPGTCEGDPCGFADAQIGPDGVLFASHFSTGKVVVYDTIAGERLPDVAVGASTWSAFVDPFHDESTAFVPSWDTETVAKVGLDGTADVWTAGDSEVYGVNFSAQAPDEAFVLNRTRNEVAILDRVTGERIDTLDVGGTTETGTTTPDGRLLLPISSTGEVAVIDTATHEELARFSGVGSYPWSVSTAEGQNYCH
ncbi:MAG: YncE family protein [Myxococcota bacterium]